MRGFPLLSLRLCVRQIVFCVLCSVFCVLDLNPFSKNRCLKDLPHPFLIVDEVLDGEPH
jgi:hypothetical protein